MIRKTNYTVDSHDLEKSQEYVFNFSDFKTPINKPTGNFFYDPWIIKDEFKNSCWSKLLGALNFPVGEARVIGLESKTCYTQHADIDDRYHLNLTGDAAYLIDLTENITYPTKADAAWYHMDTGKLHTAINCGEFIRYQLVVRSLLQDNQLKNSKGVKLIAGGENPRYKFDNYISPWLNFANKSKIITDFSVNLDLGYARFDIEEEHIQLLEKILPDSFYIELTPPRI